MIRRPAGLRRLAWPLALLSPLACEEPNRMPSAEPTAPPPALILQPIPGESGGQLLYALSLKDRGGVVVGSYRVTVHYDSARVTFIRASGADSMLTAVNDVGGRVLIAGAAATGFSDGAWVTLTFAARAAGSGAAGSGAAGSGARPTLELFEIADVNGRDLRPAILVEPPRASAPRQ